MAARILTHFRDLGDVQSQTDRSEWKPAAISEVAMSSAAQDPLFTTRLTPAEREWIRRQGRSSRALEAEQRRVRAELAAKEMRRREQLMGGRPRFQR
jgi:hypothetical protein